MPKSQSYDSLNSELESILTELQSADLEIDDAVAKYERGMEIVKQQEKYLKSAENKVHKVKHKQ